MVWNALDYTALVIPTGSYVDESVDIKKPPHQFYNDLDKANYELCKLGFFFFFPSSADCFVLISHKNKKIKIAVFR